MKLRLENSKYILTENGLDISIPLREGDNNVNAWYVDPLKIEPVRGEGFIGDTQQGGAVNFKNICLNPHGNGTHTECVGHIAKETYTINQCLKEFHFYGKLVTINPEVQGEDYVLTKKAFEEKMASMDECTVLIIRTLPNDSSKCTRKYSGHNPPYLDIQAMQFLLDLGMQHLMIDLPSVDREQDDGKVLAHHLFWNYPENPDTTKTITELIYVDNAIPDGTYFVNIQITSLELDASPSKIVLYELHDE